VLPTSVYRNNVVQVVGVLDVLKWFEVRKIGSKSIVGVTFV